MRCRIFTLLAAALLIWSTRVATGQEKQAKGVEADSLSADVLEAAFQLLLDEDEKLAYNLVTDYKEKVAWRERYWREHDPTPTTPRNERREEHYRRIRYARQWFVGHLPNALGVDDRGVIYIRYGEPDSRYRQTGTGPIRSNESWAYQIGPGLLFEFVETGAGFQLRDLQDAIVGVTGQRGQYLSLLLELYQGRIDVHPRYAEIYQRLLVAEQDAVGRTSAVAAINDTTSEVVALFDQGLSSDTYTSDLESYVTEVQQRIYRERSRAPRTRYRFDYKAKPLPIVFSFANFRERGSLAKVELLYGVDFGEIGVRGDRQGSEPVTFNQRLVIFDAMMTPIGGDSGTVQVRPRRDATAPNQFYVNNATLRLKPGGYRLAFNIREPVRRRLGIYKTAFTAREFATDRLDLSDIVFSHYIREGTADQLLKIGRDIAPYPFSKVERKRPIYVYFEIYNLTPDDFGQTNYRISYTVRRTKGASILRKLLGGEQAEVSASLERFGSSPDVGEYLQLDLSELPIGNSVLLLEVEDLNAGTKAQMRRRFELVP